MEAQVAPRLRRWALATGLALAGILIATLPPGPPTVALLFLPFWEEPERTGLDGQLQAVNSAFHKAEWELRVARARTALAEVGPGGASPIVLHVAEHSATATVDTGFTSHVKKLWRVHRIPTGPVRTVLVSGTAENMFDPGLVQPPGVCIARLVDRFEMRRRIHRVGNSAGLCAIVSRHGVPGESVRRWVDGVGPLMVPEVAPWVDPEIHPVEAGVQWPEWAVGARPTYEFRVPWWASRAVLACGKGRAEFCREAVGLGDWIPVGPRFGRYSLAYPSELPAALIAELGPERFGELWRSDAPIPESFERLSGTSFDPWVMQFVQRRIGRIAQPTALGLGGWLGWIFWMGLLTGWTFVRLRGGRAR
jgi:hypothetical protein